MNSQQSFSILFSAALVELAKSIPTHSLILSSHLFFCLPLLLFNLRPKGSGGYSDEPGVRPSVFCPLYNLNTVLNILMVLQVMTMCRVKDESHRFNTFRVISPLMFFMHIRVRSLWNIIMILHSYVEQVMTMCRVQE